MRRLWNPIVAAAKQQVANQLYNVNQFVDIMGPIAVGIENFDKEAKTNRRIKKELVDENERNKQKMVLAIRGMRQGLSKLETDFRTKPQLSKYLLKIQGISTLCAQSEDNAIAGRRGYQGDGMLTISGDRIELTREGLLHADALLPAFFEPEHRGVRYT